MEKKLPDTELVEALQKASQAEVSRLIHSEIAYSSQQRNSVILYEATKALLRFLPGPTTGQDWRHLFEQLANQKCTSISRRLSEIRLYVLNRSTLNVARQFPFIQWSWLDQAPVIPNEILQKHLEIAKNAYLDVMIVNKNRGPYFELTGIWLGLEITKNEMKKATKKFSSLPLAHANSFLENMAIDNFDNNHFRSEIALRLGNTKTEKYWKYLFELVEKNQDRAYTFKPSQFSRITPMKSQISQLLEIDDSKIGKFLRILCTPRLVICNYSSIKQNQRDPKIAIVVSGQMRNYQAGLDTQRRMFEELKADVFISTWSDTGKKAADNQEHAMRIFQGKALDVLREVWTELGNEEFLKRYALVFSNKSQSKISVEDLEKVYRTPRINICVDEDIDLSNNSEKMYYRWQRAVQVFDLGKYDLIIRIRPDTIIEYHSNFRDQIDKLNYMNKETVLVDAFPNSFHRIGVVCGDSVAMGPSSLMLDYLQTHSSFSVTHPPIYGRPSKYVEHANLAWVMISKGFKVEKLEWSTGIAQQSEDVQLQFLEEFKSLLTQRFQLFPDEYDLLLLSAIEETYFI